MFKNWFAQKYRDWRGDDITRASSITAFARWLGINQQVVDGYLKGDNVPRHRSTIDKLVAKFGPEVYKVLGMEVTPLDQVISEVTKLPEEAYPELLSKIQDLLQEYQVQELPSGRGRIPPPR